MTTIAAKRCSNCQWKHDKIYCRGRKRHGDFIKFIKSQLKYCAENNYLHAMCAVSLREKQLYLQRIDPRMTSILGDFVLVPNTEPIFNLDSPDTAAYFYKTAREDKREARAKELEKLRLEQLDWELEWERIEMELNRMSKELYKSKNDHMLKWQDIEARQEACKQESSSDEYDDVDS